MMLNAHISTFHVLKELYTELQAQNVHLQFADLKGPMRDVFQLNGLYELLGKSNFFLSVNDALATSKKENNFKIDTSSIQAF